MPTVLCAPGRGRHGYNLPLTRHRLVREIANPGTFKRDAPITQHRSDQGDQTVNRAAPGSTYASTTSRTRSWHLAARSETGRFDRPCRPPVPGAPMRSNRRCQWQDGTGHVSAALEGMVSVSVLCHGCCADVRTCDFGPRTRFALRVDGASVGRPRSPRRSSLRKSPRRRTPPVPPRERLEQPRTPNPPMAREGRNTRRQRASASRPEEVSLPIAGCADRETAYMTMS